MSSPYNQNDKVICIDKFNSMLLVALVFTHNYNHKVFYTSKLKFTQTWKRVP